MGVLRIVIVDDDEEVQRQWQEWSEGAEYNVAAVDTVLDAVKLNADVYVIDITSVASVMQPEFAAYPICGLIDRHPGAEIVIVSAVGRRTAEDVIDRIFSSMEVRVRYGGTGGFEAVEQVLKEVSGVPEPQGDGPA